MLEIDTSRPFRSATQLAELVDAVEAADPHDELDWIEWKSALDLAELDQRGHLARHILGMANRDPDRAGRVAGGCGYVLIGVEPGSCPGIDPIDPADLEPQTQRFLGDDGPVWQPLWIRRDDRHVLVVIADPPQQGDLIHTLRKPFNKYDAADIFVRRNGATHKANPEEIKRLSARARSAAGGAQLNVVVSAAKDALRVTPLDCSPSVLERWLDAERRRLLAPLEAHLAAQAEENEEDAVDPDAAAVTVPKDSPLAAVAAVAEQMRRSHALLSGRRKPEDRSPDKYRHQVDRYLEAAADGLVGVAADRHIRDGSCRLMLSVSNPTDFPFRDVEVELSIPGDVWATDGPSYEKLPPPRIWGDRWVDPLSALMPGVTMPEPRPWGPDHLEPVGGPWVEIENGDPATLTFSSVDLAPHATKPLATFDLLVPPGLAGQLLIARWTARSTHVPGVAEGTLAIDVDNEVVDAADLLDRDEEDDE